MKKAYIQPITETVCLNSNKAFLQDPSVNGPLGSNDTRAISMDGNSSSFEEDDSWAVSSNKSLWDD